MVLWRFFGPGGSIRQLHQLRREERLAEGRAFFVGILEAGDGLVLKLTLGGGQNILWKTP